MFVTIFAVAAFICAAAFLRAMWVGERENYERGQRFFKEQEKWQKEQSRTP